jgi:hypothetical protein
MDYENIYKEKTLRISREGVIIRKNDSIKFFEKKDKFYEEEIELCKDEELLMNVKIDFNGKIFFKKLKHFYLKIFLKKKIFSKYIQIFKIIILKKIKNSIQYGKLLARLIIVFLKQDHLEKIT